MLIHSAGILQVFLPVFMYLIFTVYIAFGENSHVVVTLSLHGGYQITFEVEIKHCNKYIYRYVIHTNVERCGHDRAS
ncbi:hypothetical protein MNV_1710004 [Candidatus Methanoperedens nitroreducens]|uniref:Uncharacterized protein n=1 Tax=Candidatus Methanoperedens nitratireducens TaxID=1392998 RepID=A0A284VM05_9EURY|nr:hypothetical protein MNV_1710004 [Candidatus Methanoperedens nitroreducens]